MVAMRIHGENAVGPNPLVVLCPGCRREGTFRAVANVNDLQTQNPNGGEWRAFGSRVCPNSSCRTHVFVIYDNSGRLLASFPIGRIDFDASSVPAAVTRTFEEVLTCAANECYVASAMLIRKTLEELCEDQQAQGSDLKARIAELRNKVTLPKDLFDALDHLRLLGNDAAHVEAKTYNGVGHDEVQVGIELTKEIIKAVYQYKGLLGKLQALKKP